MHQREDREDPRGAEFKAISAPAETTTEISELLSRETTAHMCLCVHMCSVSVMFHEDKHIKGGKIASEPMQDF